MEKVDSQKKKKTFKEIKNFIHTRVDFKTN